MGLKAIRKKKWFGIITNIYVLVLTVFVIWMAFFDTNSLLIHMELRKEIKKLEKTQDFLKKEIAKELSQLFGKGNIVFLEGTLGSGKTAKRR